MGSWDEAEPRTLDHVLRETASLEVRARLDTGLARELGLAKLEEVLKQIGTPVTRDSSLDRAGIDASSSREVFDHTDELFAARNGAAADVGRPERRLTAVDEKATRCRPVRHDTLSPNAESGVCVLLAGGDRINESLADGLGAGGNGVCTFEFVLDRPEELPSLVASAAPMRGSSSSSTLTRGIVVPTRSRRFGSLVMSAATAYGSKVLGASRSACREVPRT